MERTILHVDMNNFYASVECLYNPEIRGKPVAVGGDVEARHGIVLAKNYIAKRYGVQTGEALWQAREKCPDIIFVKPNFERYLKYSQMAREIYADYSDRVESFGLDECWIDVSGCTNLFGEGKKIADGIRRRIRYELGVTASVGVSFNKIFAKLGSDLKKPDATTEISRRAFRDIVWPLPVGDLLYVGRATKNKLKRYGINTIGKLANTDIKLLEYAFGKNGRMLWMFANGYDTSAVANIGAKSLIKSVGNSSTTPRDLISDEDVKITLYALCESVAERLREHGFLCAVIQISLRDNTLYAYERQGKLRFATNLSGIIFEKAYELYRRNQPDKPIRSIGVRACSLIPDEGVCQLSFLPEENRVQKQMELEYTIDTIRRRFGHFSVQRGIMLQDRALSAINPKDDHIIHPIAYLK